MVYTSAWLDYLRGRGTEEADLVGHVLDEGVPFGITAVIYQKILQVAASEKEGAIVRLR